MKSRGTERILKMTPSLLSRGAWIEIIGVNYVMYDNIRRSSHEERGLKLQIIQKNIICLMSLLSRGAWIEMLSNIFFFCRLNGRSSHEERGLKFFCQCYYYLSL